MRLHVGEIALNILSLDQITTTRGSLVEARSDLASLRELFVATRQRSRHLLDPLHAEDAQIQVYPFASPAKWHLAHTTWFFDEFVLSEFSGDSWERPELFDVLFNSYYEGVGSQHPRHQRGALSRPTLDEVQTWRRRVTDKTVELLDCDPAPELRRRVQLGIHHEKQHQELMLTDILANFSANPLKPAYRDQPATPYERASDEPDTDWTTVDGGRYRVGCKADGFSYDNERPAHDVLIQDFALRNSLVTNAEVIEFIEDGGYADHRLWLSDGISWVRDEDVTAPLYWRHDDHRGWMHFTLHGEMPVAPDAPAVHLSGYEADAIATWAGYRLPTEFEWEVAALQSGTRPDQGSFETDTYVPHHRSLNGTALQSLWGEVWEWTRSAYSPYPGYRPEPGALGEYNGKFMANQWVLRGGSLATPSDHLRRTYRNFFYPSERWQFMGVRFTKDEP
jgi:ergothioneine biosynthesis protein EgtB